MDAVNALVFTLVVVSRLGFPLLIPRFPLPAIITCLVIDGVDQTVFQTFTDMNLDWYQGYDKALDVYYLSIALIATMRNWTNATGFAGGRFLYYWRLVGVALFEALQLRWLLLVFTNAFEYFFIAYETVRTRWDPARWSRRGVIGTIAAIWIFIKLPQEYWIHIAQLDTTDEIRAHPVIAAVLAVVALVAAAIAYRVLRPRVPPPVHAFTLAAGPLPEGVDTVEKREAFVRERWSVFGAAFGEKLVLVGLVCVIFAMILPGMTATPTQIAVGVAVLIAFNSVVGQFAARTGRGIERLALAFVTRAAINLAFVVVVRWVLPGETRLDAGHTLFFLLLLTLIVTFYDRYRPVHDYRVAHGQMSR